MHYGKASASVKAEQYPCEYIRIRLEQVAMCEYHVATYGGSAATIRNLQSALEYLFATKKALEYLGTLKNDKETETRNEKGTKEEGSREGNEKHDRTIDFDELKTLVPIMETRLMNVLKELVKAHTTLKNKGKLSKDWGGLETTKRMYSVALRRSSSGASEQVVEKCQRIAETIKSLEEIKKESR